MGLSICAYAALGVDPPPTAPSRPNRLSHEPSWRAIQRQADDGGVEVSHGESVWLLAVWPMQRRSHAAGQNPSCAEISTR